MVSVRFLFGLLLISAGALRSADAPYAVPASLKPDGIPALPGRIAEELAQYNESRPAALQDWSPAKREMLITTRFGDVPQVHRLQMPGGAREQVTFYPDRVAGARYNPANADEFLFAKDTGGGEFYQLYLLNLKTRKTTMLTDGKRTRNMGPAWSRDGKWVAWSSTRRNGASTDIWVKDPHQPGDGRLLVEAPDAGWDVDDWSPDNTQLLVSHARSIVSQELYLVDLASGKKTKLGPQADAAAWQDARFTGDGKSVWLRSNEGSEFSRLVVLDLQTGKTTPVQSNAHWDVEGVEVSHDGRYVAYSSNEDGYSALHVLDSKTRSEVSVPALPRGVIGGLRWRANTHELGVTLTTAQIPGDVFSLDIDSGKVERWTTGETGGIDVTSLKEPQLIHWKSFDGRSISGFLYPASAKFTGPRPVIINIHGGPEGQSRPVFLAALNYFTNELGISLIFPNVRGSTGYGKTYVGLDNGNKREDSVKDIGALLDWIGTEKSLDASRVMATGGSYGGYMTLAVMTHYSDRVRCALEQVGISNFRTFLEHTEAYRRDLRRVEYGDERDPGMRDYFETISPMNNAKKITRPMFIVAGKNDPRVPYTEGVQMTGALRGNNVPTWFLLGEDEGHGFVKKRNRDYLFAATVEFVNQYLLN